MNTGSTQREHFKLLLGIKSPLGIVLFSIPVILTLGLLATPWYMLAPVPAIGLAILMIFFNYPGLAYYGIVFLIPFGAFRTLPGGLKIPWLLAAILLLVIGMDALVNKNIPKNMHAKIWPWMFLYLALTFIATILSPYPQTANHNLILLVAAMLFLGLTLAMIDQHGFTQVLPNVLIWSISIGSLLAVLGFFFRIELFADKVSAGEFTRGVGASTDPNNLALMVIFIIPLLAYKFVHTNKLSMRLLIVALLVINFGAVVASYSRGGMLILCFSFILVLWEFGSRLRPQHIFISMLLLLAGGTLALITVPSDYWKHQTSLASFEDASLKRRSSYLIVGWNAIKESPILGHGPGTFRDIYGKTAVSASFQKKGAAKRGETLRRRAHNTYLENFVGLGILGGSAFLAILVVTFHSFCKAKHLFMEKNNILMAELVGSYRIAFITTAVFLLIFTDLFHKLLLLSIGLSQIALYFARKNKI